MLIGYARVSTKDQNATLQTDALKKAGCEKIFEDKITGKHLNREGLEKAMDMLRAGDTLVVWRLDRLARSLKDLITLINQLEENKIGFKSITESIDTTTPSGRLIFHIFGALAEFERNLNRERTMAGLEVARARGRKGGRRQKLSGKQKALAIKLHKDKENSIADICQALKISKQTLYNYIGKSQAEK